MRNIPTKINEWLNARGITDDVILAHNLSWTGTHIAIPIYDIGGKFLFNKYRRDPFSDVGPKYKYEIGTTAQLFNAHRLSSKHSVHIVEGEMDAMLLESKGYLAVSTTGGAGTWKDEWTALLAGKDIYVCYDNDEAGIKGAMKLLTKVAGKLVMIPQAKGIKDITDYIKEGGSYPILLEHAEEFSFLRQAMPELKTIANIKNYIKEIDAQLNKNLDKERYAKSVGNPFAHYDIVRTMLVNAKDNLKRKIRRIQYLKKPAEITGNENGKITNQDIFRAKDVPLENFLDLNEKGFAHCPFHGKDKTASLRVYKNQNKFYCFSCAAGNDVIDFMMKLEKCNFIEAVKKLLKK